MCLVYALQIRQHGNSYLVHEGGYKPWGFIICQVEGGPTNNPMQCDVTPLTDENTVEPFLDAQWREHGSVSDSGLP